MNFKHGDARNGRVTSLHKIWRSMIGRCYCKTQPAYNAYGGRGIKICDSWLHDYVCFRNWAIANGYSNMLTLDRIDNNGDYSPNNCRFATRKEQARNRRSSKFITFRGRTQTQAAWAEELGMKQETISYRTRKGWPAAKILFRPLTPFNRRIAV